MPLTLAIHPITEIRFAERFLLDGTVVFVDIDELRRLVLEQAEERQAAVQRNVRRLKEQASRISIEIKELIRMRAQGLISDQEFVAEKAVLSKKQLSLEIAKKNDSLSISEIQRSTMPAYGVHSLGLFSDGRS